MYEKIKSWISNNRFFIGMGIGAVLFLACYLFCHRATDNITNAIQSAQEHNRRAGELADTAREEVKAAEADITGAVNNVERTEGIINQNAETLEECRNLVSTVRDRTREAKSILADIERANEEAAGNK